MGTPEKVLMFCGYMDDSFSWAEEKIKERFPKADIVKIEINQSKPFWAQLKELLSLRSQGGVRHSFLPFDFQFLKSLSFWYALAFFIMGSIGARRCVDKRGTVFSPMKELSKRSYILPLFYSVIIILRLPVYLFEDIYCKFLASKEYSNDGYTK